MHAKLYRTKKIEYVFEFRSGENFKTSERIKYICVIAIQYICMSDIFGGSDIFGIYYIFGIFDTFNILIQPQSELDIGSWCVTYPPPYPPPHPPRTLRVVVVQAGSLKQFLLSLYLFKCTPPVKMFLA